MSESPFSHWTWPPTCPRCGGKTEMHAQSDAKGTVVCPSCGDACRYRVFSRAEIEEKLKAGERLFPDPVREEG